MIVSSKYFYSQLILVLPYGEKFSNNKFSTYARHYAYTKINTSVGSNNLVSSNSRPVVNTAVR